MFCLPLISNRPARERLQVLTKCLVRKLEERSFNLCRGIEVAFPCRSLSMSSWTQIILSIADIRNVKRADFVDVWGAFYKRQRGLVDKVSFKSQFTVNTSAEASSRLMKRSDPSRRLEAEALWRTLCGQPEIFSEISLSHLKLVCASQQIYGTYDNYTSQSSYLVPYAGCESPRNYSGHCKRCGMLLLRASGLKILRATSKVSLLC